MITARCSRTIQVVAVCARDKNKSRNFDIKNLQWVDDPLALANALGKIDAYARGILEGIVEYQRTRDQWSIFLPELERGARPPSWLSHWKGDGVIARIETEEIAQAVTNLRVPTIDVSAARRVPTGFGAPAASAASPAVFASTLAVASEAALRAAWIIQPV
jgi:hypothetical protein